MLRNRRSPGFDKYDSDKNQQLKNCLETADLSQLKNRFNYIDKIPELTFKDLFNEFISEKETSIELLEQFLKMYINLVVQHLNIRMMEPIKGMIVDDAIIEYYADVPKIDILLNINKHITKEQEPLEILNDVLDKQDIPLVN